MKADVSNTTEENKRIIANINKEKFKAMVLPMLCSLLMILEFTLHVLLNIDITVIVICTFILSSIIHIYVFYKLDVALIRLSIVMTAIHNNIRVKEWMDMDRAQSERKGIQVVRVKRQSLLTEYIAVCLSCIICISTPFFSLADKFL